MNNSGYTPVPSLTALELEGNKQEFKDLLLFTKREGVEKLIEYLETKTDFFKAPASSRFHNNQGGGLCDHSLNVYRKLEKLHAAMAEDLKIETTVETRIITSLLHDVCKANYYVEKVCFKKNDMGRWENFMGWGIDEKLPLGHGEKSVTIVNKFLTMTLEEMLAIRWHMGAWESGVKDDHEKSAQFRSATEMYKFVKFFQLADVAAEMSEPRFEL